MRFLQVDPLVLALASARNFRCRSVKTWFSSSVRYKRAWPAVTQSGKLAWIGVSSVQYLINCSPSSGLDFARAFSGTKGKEVISCCMGLHKLGRFHSYKMCSTYVLRSHLRCRKYEYRTLSVRAFIPGKRCLFELVIPSHVQVDGHHEHEWRFFSFRCVERLFFQLGDSFCQ